MYRTQPISKPPSPASLSKKLRILYHKNIPAKNSNPAHTYHKLYKPMIPSTTSTANAAFFNFLARFIPENPTASCKPLNPNSVNLILNASLGYMNPEDEDVDVDAFDTHGYDDGCCEGEVGVGGALRR